MDFRVVLLVYVVAGMAAMFVALLLVGLTGVGAQLVFAMADGMK